MKIIEAYIRLFNSEPDTMDTNNDHIQALLLERILNEFLPKYCDDVKRNYAKEGFKLSSVKVLDEDAYDFMRAIDYSVVLDIGGGRYTMPKSKATEVIFWEGSKSKTPRSISLWLEPLITIAAISRLHLDYGWPKELLGMQSRNWEFDLVVYRSIDSDDIFIAGEIKKTTRELVQLIALLTSFDVDSVYDYKLLPSSTVNAHKKWLGLCRYRAPFFWGVGPGNDSRLFEVSYSINGNVTLTSCSSSLLVCKPG